jgi:hypothetical protein
MRSKRREAVVRFWLPLLVVLHLTAVAAPARADGLYVSEELGVSRVGGRLGHFFRGGMTFDLGGGYHTDGWAFEGQLRLDRWRGRGVFDGQSYGVESWGLAVRRLFPVSPSVRLYARGGLERLQVTQWDRYGVRPGDGYQGSGLDLGGGLVLSGRVPLIGFLFAPLFLTDIGPKVSAAAWLDVGDRLLSLEKPDASRLQGFTRSWLLGFSIGGAF